MTSWGQAMTQPEQPVHSPEVITSSYSSSHWLVQRSRFGGAVCSVTDMIGTVGPEPAATFRPDVVRLLRAPHRRRCDLRRARRWLAGVAVAGPAAQRAAGGGRRRGTPAVQ